MDCGIFYFIVVVLVLIFLFMSAGNTCGFREGYNGMSTFDPNDKAFNKFTNQLYTRDPEKIIDLGGELGLGKESVLGENPSEKCVKLLGELNRYEDRTVLGVDDSRTSWLKSGCANSYYPLTGYHD